MAKRAGRTKARSHAAGRNAARSASTRRMKNISKASAQIVKDAAALLDDEIAAGIVAAKKMQQRFQKERRIDPADFHEALQRFQSDAHEVVNLLNEQIAELRTEENAALMTRLMNNTHGLLDLTVGLVNMGAEIANQLVHANLPKQNAKPGGRRGG